MADAKQSKSRVFVGREREIAELDSGTDDALGGRGGLFLVVGEPGIGKTRLVDEAISRATERGLTPLWGRSWEAGGAPAYWPWIQILRAALREYPSHEARIRAALGELLPESRSEEAPSDAAQARFRVFDAVSSVLGEAAALRPLAIALEDLHAADPSSLALLLFLAHELRRLPLFVVATYRAEEVRLEPEREQMLSRIAREGTYLPLRRFSESEVRALFERRAPKSEGSEDLLTAVVEATEGHPLFVDEMLRTLTSGRVPSGGRLPLPQTVRDAIRERIARLDATTRTPLEAAAVLGRELTAEALAKLVGIDAGRLDEPIRTAIAAGVLIEIDPGFYAFSHALVRDALYREIEIERRARLHARAAEVLESERAPESGLGEIALHLLEALPVVGPERALAGAMQAAGRAMRAYAYEDAAAILERALETVEPLLSNPRAVAEALLVAGEARARARLDGRRACVRAAEIARELDDPELLARAGLALGAEIAPSIVLEELVKLLGEAARRLPPEPSAIRARVLARLAGALQPAANPGEPVELARDAIRMAKSLGDEPTLRAVLHGAGSALCDYEHPRARLEENRELFRLAQAAGDASLAFRAELRAFFDYAELGLVHGADQTIASLERLAAELKRPRNRFYVAMLKSVRALQRGDFAEAERLEAEGRALVEGADDRALAITLVSYDFGSNWIRWREERISAAARVFAHYTEGMPRDFQRVFATMWLAHGGELAKARARLEELDFLAPVIRWEFGLQSFLAELQVSTEHLDGSVELLGYMEARRDCFASLGVSGLVVLGPILTGIASLEAQLGRYDAAWRDFEQAAVRCQDTGSEPALARTQFEYGRALIAHGGTDERQRGRALLGQADERAKKLDLPGLRRRIEALGRVPAPTASVSKLVDQPRFSLEREGDVWKVTCRANVFRLKHTRGLSMLAELVAEPGRERHVLLLGGGSAEADGGDAGELLDPEAVRAYRNRLDDLREQEREAEAFGDSARLATARNEIDAIAQELAGGVGLGGRRRRAGAAAERARSNVQRRIKDAIKRIEECDPELGRYLGWTVKTGIFCIFDPGKSQG